MMKTYEHALSGEIFSVELMACGRLAGIGSHELLSRRISALWVAAHIS